MISAVVLAAGKSERMGRPKALLTFRGRTFLENILETIWRSPIGHTVVVLGHHHEEIRRRVAMPSVVFNADYEQGMITSFQAGIRALPPDTAGCFLFLVDHPVVDTVTIEALISGLAPNRVVLPAYHGRRGHPVLFASELFEEVLALPASQGANIIVRKDPTRILEVPVNEPGILVDIDTPEQFKQLIEDQI